MVLDSIMLKKFMPDLRPRVVKLIDGSVEALLSLHVEYEDALNKLMKELN